MKVAKITLWDGVAYYTSNLDNGHIRRFIERAKLCFEQDGRSTEVLGQLDIIEMTAAEYHRRQQPADSAELFGEENGNIEQISGVTSEQ
jgi:hypothetical protein